MFLGADKGLYAPPFTVTSLASDSEDAQMTEAQGYKTRMEAGMAPDKKTRPRQELHVMASKCCLGSPWF